MVSTNDILLTGGLLLGVLYLKKRSDQVSTIAPLPYYEQIEAVNLERLTEYGSRIEQLKDIRSQILSYEKGQAEQQISFLQSEISEAQQAMGVAQKALRGGGGSVITTKIARFLDSINWNLPQAFSYYSNLGQSKEARAIRDAAARQSYIQTIMQSEEFIAQAEKQQADIMAKYSELEQIV